ncbi:MAG TPA: hypothetical protein VFO89_01705, partial [Thermoanaerobaculia bacterium]|nr:hypothetical protein [Thermoanaerobaculia bacterium]
MIVFGLFVFALVLVGFAVVRWMWRRVDPAGLDDTPVTELLNAGALAGAGGWLALNWILALTGTLAASTLAAGVAAILGGAVVVLVRSRHRLRAMQVADETARMLLVLVPLFIWVIFILWRGVVLPPASHDVLAYHLPKAVLLERAGGWEHFEAPDARISNYPYNYELLLADVLILSGSDTYTEWIGTVSSLLMLLATAAFAQRWWRGSAAATVAAVLAAASAPVLLLHSGADKNDLLVAWLAASALLWGSRWFVSGGRMPMALLIVALGIGLGTKTTIVATGVALAPFLAWRAASRIRRRLLAPRDVALSAALALLLLLLGGGFTHFVTLFRTPGASDLTRVAETATTVTKISWGDWSNLWQVPYLLVTIPFGSNPQGVWVPWKGEAWFWPHYEIYFSHYGRLISILLFAVPFVMWKFARGADESIRVERRITAAAAALAILIMLPTVFRPLGFFGALARYLAFVVPLIAAYTLPPLVDALRGVNRRLAGGAMAVLAIVFSLEAAACAMNDRFAPVEYAVWAAEHPGTRFIHFYPYRAGSIVDRLAGPNDSVAVD